MIKKMTEAGLGMVISTVDVLIDAVVKIVSGCIKKSEWSKTSQKQEETVVKEEAKEQQMVEVIEAGNP